MEESERFVVRFDNRDTGLSDCVDFESSPYTINDMAADAVSILDAYDLLAAHMVGASGGGLICQVLALEHRRRVLTISALISSPLGTGSNELPNSGTETCLRPQPSFLNSSKILLAKCQRTETLLSIGLCEITKRFQVLWKSLIKRLKPSVLNLSLLEREIYRQ